MQATDFNIVLGKAVKQLADIEKKLKVPTKGGKQYVMVQDRIRIFRNNFGLDAKIITEQTYEGMYVRSVTSVWVNDNLVANGIAEENRNANYINKTSAAEVAETSSIGRALSNLGLMGSEYPSGDEMLQALINQNKIPEKSGSGVDDNGNKPGKSSSQLHKKLPNGWDKMDLVTQVQTFSAVIEKASHPGEVETFKAPYKDWFEKLKPIEKKEVINVLDKKNKEFK